MAVGEICSVPSGWTAQNYRDWDPAPWPFPLPAGPQSELLTEGRGRGFKDSSRPQGLAVCFSSLFVCCEHLAWTWQQTAVSLVTGKPNLPVSRRHSRTGPACPPRIAEPCRHRTPSRFQILKTLLCSLCFLSLKTGQASHSVWSLCSLLIPGVFSRPSNLWTDSFYHTPSQCTRSVFCFPGWGMKMDFNWHFGPCSEYFKILPWDSLPLLWSVVQFNFIHWLNYFWVSFIAWAIQIYMMIMHMFITNRSSLSCGG